MLTLILLLLTLVLLYERRITIEQHKEEVRLFKAERDVYVSHCKSMKQSMKAIRAQSGEIKKEYTKVYNYAKQDCNILNEAIEKRYARLQLLNKSIQSPETQQDISDLHTEIRVLESVVN